MARRAMGPGRAEDFGGRRLLDIARDHPEAVGALDRTRIPVQDWGRVTLASLPGSADLAESIAMLTAWRGRIREPLGS